MSSPRRRAHPAHRRIAPEIFIPLPARREDGLDCCGLDFGPAEKTKAA